MTLDSSPEFLFETSNLYVSIKTYHALVNPWWGHFCPQSSIWSKFKYDPSTGCYPDFRPIGFQPGDFVRFNL